MTNTYIPEGGVCTAAELADAEKSWLPSLYRPAKTVAALVRALEELHDEAETGCDHECPYRVLLAAVKS